MAIRRNPLQHVRVIIWLIGAAVIYYSTSGITLAQQLPSAETVNTLYQLYKPRLPTLTPAEIEKIWTVQSQSKPWFRHVYGILNGGKDDPQFINKFSKEIPCSETNAKTRDATFAPTAYQYQCSIALSDGATILLFLNFTSAYTLASAITYQKIPFKLLIMQFKKERGVPPESEIAALMELHGDILSRIDNARAPAGSYVEYSKNMEQQKFAVRFK